MTTYTAQHLYELLPAIFRAQRAPGDAEQGGPLQQVVRVLAREIGLVEDDIAQLYANWFIETCEEWVVPYIGDLLGVRGLHPISTTEFTQRAFVANTLGYRRRKGTATVLEQLARDTTLWNARAVEFFELLSTTQYINHLRPQNVRTPDLRQTNALELLNTPFDTIAHTAEVRRIANQRGKYNIPNVGLFLWRLQAYPILRSTPGRPPGAVVNPSDGRFTFSPLGNDAPLFNRPQTEDTITHLAEEINVPGEIRRRALYDDLEAYRQALLSGKSTPFSQYLGTKQPVLEVYFDGQRLPPETIIVCNLSDWDAAGWAPPDSKSFTIPTNPVTTFETKVAVDPVLGRLALLQNITHPPTKVEVSYAYGFSGDLGGGPYDRRLVRKPGEPIPALYENSVAQPNAAAALLRIPTDFSTLSAALAAWNTAAPLTVIQIEDNRTYTEDVIIHMNATDLVIQARNNQRPTWIGNLTIQGNQQGRLALNGILIAGNITIAADDSLRQLDIRHCTLVPGITLQADGTPIAPATPSIVANSTNVALRVNIVRSITGPLRLPADSDGLTVQDSLIESPIRDRPAVVTPALVSGSLSPFPTLTTNPAMVNVTIGKDGPYQVIFANPGQPTTLAQARDALQDALQKAHNSLAFTQARVVNAANRLIVLPGIAEPITIENVNGDTTADLLRLSSTTSQPSLALISGTLTPFPTLSSMTPTVTVQIGDLNRVATLSAVPNSLAQARDRLQEAIRAADADPAFATALVSLVDNQLVVLPGIAQTRLRIDSAPADLTTMMELALESDEWLIAGDETGLQPGPPTTLERVTVLGPVHVKELTLASEVIFASRVMAERRQAGCVRFSDVVDGSRTPRRYRCQPDLAINTAIDAAKEQAGGNLLAGAEDAIRQQVLGRVVPSFTSTRYGGSPLGAAYGQLSQTCPAEITTGAEDGSEMGAFSFLKQPQRTANLRASLDEYLRFGLEAGIFYVT